MCNKCETTDFLKMVSTREFLKDGSKAQWAHSIQTQMRANMAKHNARHYRSNVFNIADSKKHYKKQGKALAIVRAIALKPANMTRVPTTLLDASLSTDYLFMLTRTASSSVPQRLEPKYCEAQRLFNSGEWESITLGELVSTDEPARVTFINQYQNSINALHMLHVSTENPLMVAYYPSLRHAREGREVRTKLGKYLTNFMDMYQLNHSTIKDMSEKHMANMQSRGAWTVEFIAHNDKDGWVNIYDMEGVDSCMRGERAVRVYANEISQLRLAYIRTDDELVARCIVRDDPDGNMTGWLRVYPDPNGYAEGRFMLDWLNANGYPNRTNLDGCMLTAEDGNGNNYVCPYIDSGDNGDQTVDIHYHNSRQYLLVGNGGLNATNTNGYTEETQHCDACGGNYDGDDMTYVDVAGECYCDDCLHNDFTYAFTHRYQEWCRADDCTEVNGTWYHNDHLSDHDIYYCEYADEYMHIDNMASTIDGPISNDYAKFLDHTHDGYDYAYEGDVVELSDGTTCHKDDEEELQATIDFDTQEEADPSDDGVANETTGEL
jgi:hypothetical protein